jgi:diadenosine tetraphosphate (Ap4A) HIT family hydrolase
MTNNFTLDPRLASDTFEITDLVLSKLLLMDNANFPWVILVPRKENICEIIDLNEEDQMQLMREISLVSRIMQEIFSPDKLNVAALGNIVPQLHVHIIARFKGDIAFPEPTFGKAKKPYETNERDTIIQKIREALPS